MKTYRVSSQKFAALKKMKVSMGDQSGHIQLIDSTLQSISVSGAEVWQDHVTYNMLIITFLVKYSPEYNVNN